jgi:hypothetical protein
MSDMSDYEFDEDGFLTEKVSIPRPHPRFEPLGMFPAYDSTIPHFPVTLEVGWREQPTEFEKELSGSTGMVKDLDDGALYDALDAHYEAAKEDESLPIPDFVAPTSAPKVKKGCLNTETNRPYASYQEYNTAMTKAARSFKQRMSQREFEQKCLDATHNLEARPTKKMGRIPIWAKFQNYDDVVAFYRERDPQTKQFLRRWPADVKISTKADWEKAKEQYIEGRVSRLEKVETYQTFKKIGLSSKKK